MREWNREREGEIVGEGEKQRVGYRRREGLSA